MRHHPRRAPYYGWVLMVLLRITTIILYGTTQYLFGVLVVPLERQQELLDSGGESWMWTAFIAPTQSEERRIKEDQ